MLIGVKTALPIPIFVSAKRCVTEFKGITKKQTNKQTNKNKTKQNKQTDKQTKKKNRKKPPEKC